MMIEMKQASGTVFWTSDVRIDVYTHPRAGDMVRITVKGREIGFSIDQMKSRARINDFACAQARVKSTRKKR